jgi:hypothetical protein
MSGLALGSYGFRKLADQLTRHISCCCLLNRGWLFLRLAFHFYLASLILYKLYARTILPERMPFRESGLFCFHLPVDTVPVNGWNSSGTVQNGDQEYRYAGHGFSNYMLPIIWCLFRMFLTGFLFIKNIGIPQTIWIGTTLNLSIILIITVTRYLEKYRLCRWLCHKNRRKNRIQGNAQRSCQDATLVLLHSKVLRHWVSKCFGPGYWWNTHDKTVYLYTVIIMSFIGGLSLGVTWYLNSLTVWKPCSISGLCRTAYRIGFTHASVPQRTMPALMLQRESMASWYGCPVEYLLILPH